MHLFLWPARSLCMFLHRRGRLLGWGVLDCKRHVFFCLLSRSHSNLFSGYVFIFTASLSCSSHLIISPAQLLESDFKRAAPGRIKKEPALAILPENGFDLFGEPSEGKGVGRGQTDLVNEVWGFELGSES